MTQQWADLPAEEQVSDYSYYMIKIAWISFLGLVLDTLYERLYDWRKTVIRHSVHKETLKTVLLAPINLFFDVTPLGKIIAIFTEDLDVF